VFQLILVLLLLSCAEALISYPKNSYKSSLIAYGNTVVRNIIVCIPLFWAYVVLIFLAGNL
jgi:hypothetical protein